MRSRSELTQLRSQAGSEDRFCPTFVAVSHRCLRHQLEKMRSKTTALIWLTGTILLLAGCDRPSDGNSKAPATAATFNAPTPATSQSDRTANHASTLAMGSAGSSQLAITTPSSAEIAVPEPDWSIAEPAVQARLREYRAAFDRMMTTNTAPAARAELWGRLGLFYFAYQFPATAAACYTNAVFHAPADHRSWYGLAECRFEEDALDGAVAAMQLALHQMRGTTNATLADQNSARRFLGDTFERLGRLPEALEQFQSVLVNEPGDLYSLVKAGQLHSLTGGGLGAVHYLESALRRAPRNRTIRSLLAQEYHRTGLTNEAQRLAQPLETGTPESSSLVRPDPWRRAAAALVESPAMFIRRGNQLAQRGQPLRAITAYEAALRLEPTNTAAAINLSTAMMTARRPADARRILEEIAAHGVPSDELRYNLAMAKAATGATKEALEAVQQWRKEQPENLLALQLEATVRQALGDLPASLAALQEYLRIKPGTAPIIVRLARLQVRTGQPAAARETLETAMQQKTNNPALRHELARLLALNPQAEVRDPARAVELMRPLMSVRSSLPQIETLILALHAAGEKDAAAERFQRLTNSLAKQTNTVLVARLEQLGTVLTSPKAVQEPWPFALNARASNPEDAGDEVLPAPTP